MTRVVVPVRYPLSSHSKRTLERAIEVAAERDGDLTVLHVDLYQSSGSVSRTTLRKAVERTFGKLDRTRYVVRKGFLVEETILEEAAEERADVVVIGGRQAGRWRKMLKRVFEGPDVDSFLREHLNCDVVTVG